VETDRVVGVKQLRDTWKISAVVVGEVVGGAVGGVVGGAVGGVVGGAEGSGGGGESVRIKESLDGFDGRVRRPYRRR
jgi:hypothetical protein